MMSVIVGRDRGLGGGGNPTGRPIGAGDNNGALASTGAAALLIIAAIAVRRVHRVIA